MLLLIGLAVPPVLAAGQDVGKSSVTAAETQSPPNPSGPAAIPAADIATRATQVTNLLRNLSDRLTQSDQIDEIKQSFSKAAKLVKVDSEETSKLLQGQPALPTLQSEQQKWQQTQLAFSQWLTTLTERSQELQDGLDQLIKMQSTWSLTLKSAKESNIPAAGIQQINEILATIGNAITPLKAELSMIIDFQSEVGSAASESGDLLAKVTQLQTKAMSGTLVQDSLPIWSTELWARVANNLPEVSSKALAAYKTRFSNYFVSSSRYLYAFVSFLLLFIFFLTLRFKARELSTLGEVMSPEIRTFDHPISAALTIVLLFITSPFWSQLPSTIRQTLQLIALAPMIVLVRPFVFASLIPCLYALRGAVRSRYLSRTLLR